MAPSSQALVVAVSAEQQYMKSRSTRCWLRGPSRGLGYGLWGAVLDFAKI
jgi:hypothetical protein